MQHRFLFQITGSGSERPSGWLAAQQQPSIVCSITQQQRYKESAKKVGSMCKSLAHNLILQQQAHCAAGCGLNKIKPKPSRRLICNPSPGYGSQ